MNAFKRFGFLFALTAVTAACVPQSAGRIQASAFDMSIVGGKEASAADLVAKSTVGLLIEKDQEPIGICSGTIIFKDIILTAAHCLEGGHDKIVIIFGPDMFNAKAEMKRVVTKTAKHPDWIPENQANKKNADSDVALLKFDGGLPIGFEPSKPLSSTADLKLGETFIVAGYGIDDYKKETGAGVLRHATMVLKGAINDAQTYSDGSKGSICSGDSGGPAYVLKNGKLYIWGVADSVTRGSCSEFGIHTVILEYQFWLLTTVQTLRGS